jgi:hypothetical protein
MKGEILELELKKGRHRLLLRKVSPGPLLTAVAGAFSFFYEVSIDGSVRCHTADASVARSIWRGAHRWLFTGKSSCAEVLP